jgi:hypothetical protein
MDLSVEMQNRIVSGVINGSISIESIREFDNLLKIFPDEPGVHKLYGDFLKREGSLEAAADEYSIAARLFVGTEMPLQAVLCKVLEWRIIKPSEGEQQDFHSGLQAMPSQERPLKRFFKKITYPEWMALVGKLELDFFPPASKVKNLGDPETDLYFVAYGALKEVTYDHQPGDGWNFEKKVETNLIESDFFGQIYPFEEDLKSRSEVQAITGVEVARISKSNLVTLCREYPNIEHLVDGLYREKREADGERSSKSVRETARHQLPTKLNIKLFQNEGQTQPLNVEGFTENISLGGACVVLGEKYRTGPSDDLNGKNVKIEIALPLESLRLTLLGSVAWAKEVTLEEKTHVVVGIKFREMIERDRELLRNYCYGSDGEQNLIWSLWEWLLGK